MALTQKQVSQNIPRFIEADNQTVSQMGGGVQLWVVFYEGAINYILRQSALLSLSNVMLL